MDERIWQAIEDQTQALHTANLIALLAVECDHFDGPSAGLIESIRERLGLGYAQARKW